MPFSIGQIGKAFRNEITPGNFTFRTIEFEQMEYQTFCKPGIDHDLYEEFKEYAKHYFMDLGIPEDNLRYHPHEKLAHYAKEACDIDYKFPFGWGEINGTHNRTDYDLSRYQEYSGEKMFVVDEETKEYFLKFFDNNDIIEIKSSPVWYDNRDSYDITQLGTPRVCHSETHGFETLNGSGIVTGKLFGGCINSIYDILNGERYNEENVIFEKYNLLPTIEEWKEKVLFLETSEETISPDKLEIMLLELKRRKILDSVKGLLIGKPMDEIYYEEYKKIYKKLFKGSSIPVLYNINFGHAVPRCFLQYNALVTVDYDNKTIKIKSCKLL